MEDLWSCLVSVFVLKSYLVNLKSDQWRCFLASSGLGEHSCFLLQEPGYHTAGLVREARAVASCPYPPMAFSSFLLLTVLVGGQQDPLLVYMGISWVTNGVEPLFLC